jgi:hypothetical protein
MLAAGACAVNESSTTELSGDSLEGKADGTAEVLANPIEDVHAYDDCLLHGTSTSDVNLGTLGFRDPATHQGLLVIECIANHLTALDVEARPYNLQSVKKAALGLHGGGRQIYFLKQGSTATSTEDTTACVKVKLFVEVGATQANVTVERVKVLPAPRPDGLCSDNGEV